MPDIKRHTRQPVLQYASPQQLDELHDATLEILERTGVEVMHPEALELLRGAGAWVEGKGANRARVRIPTFLVERAIATAPSRVTLASRDGRRTMLLERNRTYFGTGSDLKYTLDLQSGERRLTVLDDVARANRLADALPNIDFVMSHGLASDVPPHMQELAQYEAMIQSTTKPMILTTFTDEQVLEYTYELGCILAGSETGFAQSPRFCIYGQFVSPFSHDRGALDRLLFCARKRIPLIYVPTIMQGASGPVTLAGALAVANAEVLAGMVIHQLCAPGAPFIYGGCISPIDMKTTVFTYASPEWRVADAILAQLSLRYGLPQFGTAGATDSKVLDEQAALEAAYTLTFAALSGVNIIHDVGYMESGLTASLEYLVICDEIISMLRHNLSGIELSSESLALDLVDQVGPGGQFMDADHTLAHMREIWYPSILDRRTHAGWQSAGGTTLQERARARARHLLDTHEVEPLPDDMRRQIGLVMERARRELSR